MCVTETHYNTFFTICQAPIIQITVQTHGFSELNCQSVKWHSKKAPKKARSLQSVDKLKNSEESALGVFLGFARHRLGQWGRRGLRPFAPLGLRHRPLLKELLQQAEGSEKLGAFIITRYLKT